MKEDKCFIDKVKIVVEIDGKRHVLVHKKEDLQPCNECSIYGFCKRGEWVCECFTDGASCFIFEKEK